MEQAIRIKEVPEVILKKRKQRQIVRANEIRAKIKQKALKRQKSGRLVFKRAEKFVKERRKQDKDKKRLKRNAKLLVRYFDEKETDDKQLLFIIRLAAAIPMNETTKKSLRVLGLPVKFAGAFVVATPENKRLIAIAEPYVTWGTPSLRSIRELVFKRGLARKEKEKAAPLMDNTVIEAELGHLGIICMEDLVHEIFTVGENFEAVNKFVGKFGLSDPLNLPTGKMSHFAIGGRYGDRGDKINDLIQAMV